MIATLVSGTRTSRATPAVVTVGRREIRLDRVAVGVLMLLAALLRVRGLGAPNLWLDESNSWLLTTYSLGAMWGNIRHSPGSPLYFLLLKAWASLFGDSEAALRSLSVLVSLPVVPIVYAIGRRVTSRPGALAAAALVAFSPLHLYFAQEARVYMLATLTAAAAAAAYLRWRDAAARALTGTPGVDGLAGRPALIAYAVTAAASLYTLTLTGILFAVLALDAVLLLGGRDSSAPPDRVQAGTRRRLLRAFLWAQAAIAAAVLPLLVAIDLSGASRSQAWRGPMGIDGAMRNLLEYFLVALHGQYFYPWDLYPAIADAWARSIQTRLVVVFPLLIIALVALLAYPPAAGGRAKRRVLYLGLFVPLLVGTIVSVRHELSLTRYMLFATPFLFVLVGAGATRAPRWLAVPALAIIGASCAYGLTQYRTIAARDSDYRPVAAALSSVDSADGVVVQPPEAGVQLAYYLRGRGIHVWGLPAGAAPGRALRPAPGRETWVALDYRSAAYRVPPESLVKVLPGTVVADRLVGGGDDRVRLIEVKDALPSATARGVSDTTRTCCASAPAR